VFISLLKGKVCGRIAPKGLMNTINKHPQTRYLIVYIIIITIFKLVSRVKQNTPLGLGN